MRALRMITGKIFLLVGSLVSTFLPDNMGIITEDGLCFITTEAGDVLVIESAVPGNYILTEAGDFLLAENGYFFITET